MNEFPAQRSREFFAGAGNFSRGSREFHGPHGPQAHSIGDCIRIDGAWFGACATGDKLVVSNTRLTENGGINVTVAQMEVSAVNRILQAVGDDSVPDNLDKLALRENLEWCAQWHLTAAQVRSSKLAKQRFSRLEKIEKTAKRLALSTTCLMPTTGPPRTWAQLSTSLPLVLQSVFDIRTY
jgi:hypothetical protein